MTKNLINKSLDISDKNFKKLSIQVSLNGLSFCVADGVTQNLLLSDAVIFENTQNPIVLKDALEKLLDTHQLSEMEFEDVVVVHKNTLFGLVPKSLFNANSMGDYLKFNTKLLSTDVLAHDEIEHQELVNVYVPYMNINNYIYELFGEFTYVHNSTVLLETLLNKQNQDQDTVCYVYVSKHQLDITVIEERKLKLHNSFTYETKEDFVYYLLFVLEQLELDTKTTQVKLFGSIEEDDEIYQLCFSYIENISIYAPISHQLMKLGEPAIESIDFTLLNTL
ncbi:MAG: DUF3822 family protein [Maribacter sp.]